MQSRVTHTRIILTCVAVQKIAVGHRRQVRCDRGARGLIPDYPVLLPVTHQPFIIHHCFSHFSKTTKQIFAVKISLINSNKLITPLDFRIPSSLCFIYSFFHFCFSAVIATCFIIIIILLFSFIFYGVLALFVNVRKEEGLLQFCF